MSLSDYKLPAKGVLQDAPVAGDVDFYRNLEIQVLGVLTMLNNRLEAVNSPPWHMVKLYSTVGGKITVGVAAAIAGYYMRPFQGATGTMTTVTAAPDSGYTFVGWSGDLSGTTNPKTLLYTMPSIINVFANFKVTGDPDPTLYSYVPLRNATGDGDSPIFFLRSRIQSLVALANVPYFINTDIYSSGSIQGATGFPTSWTLATIMASAGVGSAGAWTTHPPGNPYGYAASYSNASFALANVPDYPQHINEMVSVLQKLTHVFKAIVYTSLAYSDDQAKIEAKNATGGGTTCQDGIDAWTASWTAAPWVFSTPAIAVDRIQARTSQSGFSVNSAQKRGTVRGNLTVAGGLLNPNNGTVAVYGFFRGIDSVAYFEGYIGNNTFQKIGDGTPGALYISQVLGEAILVVTTCVNGTKGWRLFHSTPLVNLVHAPVFAL